MELSPGEILGLGGPGAKTVTQHRSKYFSIQEKNRLFAWFCEAKLNLKFIYSFRIFPAPSPPRDQVLDCHSILQMGN